MWIFLRYYSMKIEKKEWSGCFEFFFFVKSPKRRFLSSQRAAHCRAIKCNKAAFSYTIKKSSFFNIKSLFFFFREHVNCELKVCSFPGGNRDPRDTLQFVHFFYWFHSVNEVFFEKKRGRRGVSKENYMQFQLLFHSRQGFVCGRNSEE